MYKVFNIKIYSKVTKKYSFFGYAIQDEDRDDIPEMIQRALERLDEPNLRSIKIELIEKGE